MTSLSRWLGLSSAMRSKSHFMCTASTAASWTHIAQRPAGAVSWNVWAAQVNASSACFSAKAAARRRSQIPSRVEIGRVRLSEESPDPAGIVQKGAQFWGVEAFTLRHYRSDAGCATPEVSTNEELLNWYRWCEVAKAAMATAIATKNVQRAWACPSEVLRFANRKCFVFTRFDPEWALWWPGRFDWVLFGLIFRLSIICSFLLAKFTISVPYLKIGTFLKNNSGFFLKMTVCRAWQENFF